MSQARGRAHDDVGDEVPPTPQRQVPRLPEHDVPELPEDERPEVPDDDVVATPEPSLPPVESRTTTDEA